MATPVQTKTNSPSTSLSRVSSSLQSPQSSQSPQLPNAPLQTKGAEVSAPLPFQSMIDELPDGSIELITVIPADIARRLKNRAYTRDLADYIRTQVLVPSFNSHVY